MRMDTVLHIAFVDTILAKNPEMISPESKQVQQDEKTKSNFDKIVSVLQQLNAQDAARSQMTP